MQSQQHYIKTEVVAGVTTFLTMAYIAFINPTILHDAGMNKGAVFTATCLVSAFACFLIGLWANTPIGIAPGMALNLYFSYSVVQSMGIDWQHALAMVFISGLLFFLLCLTRARRLLIEAIPHNLQIAILIGISLLIAFIALQNSQIIVRNEHTLLQLGSLNRAEALLFFLGFVLLLMLDFYAIPGAIIISILSISSLALFIGLTQWQGIFSPPPSIMPTLFKMDFSGLSEPGALKAIFAFFLIAVFDATGTFIGLLNQSLFSGPADYTKKLSRGLTVDAAASTLAGVLGCASTSPFIESAAGIQSGGRTGLTAVVIGVGFLLMLFFYPLAKMIPNFAVGPALLYVACCMMRHVTELNFDSILEAAPCVLTIILIPFSFSIADGIGAGIVLYTLLHLLGRKPTNPLLIILSILFIIFFSITLCA